MQINHKNSTKITVSRLFGTLLTRVDLLSMNISKLTTRYIPVYGLRGTSICTDRCSHSFVAARTKASVDGGSKSPPTFHEVRSLSERLYRDSGLDTQMLLGHKDPRTTARFNDPRGSDWSEVKQ
jgi:integrase